MTYEELVAQRAEIDKQIAATLSAERTDALAAVRVICAKFHFTADDILSTTGRKPNKMKGATVPAKYRDEETGKEWSGRGFRPKWLQGKELSDYLILM